MTRNTPLSLRGALLLSAAGTSMAAAMLMPVGEVRAEDCIVSIDDNGSADGRASAMSDGDATSLACGRDSKAGRQSVAVGAKAVAGQLLADVAEGVTPRKKATAIGFFARASDDFTVAIGSEAWASASGSIAIGEGTKAFGLRSIAIGRGSYASEENAVALGYGSVSERANTVSVGNATLKRQIINVAAGTETNDAVNKGQLDAVGAVALAAKTTADANAIELRAFEWVTDGLSGVGGAATAVANSLAIGEDTKAEGSFSVAIGQFAVVESSAVGSVALGNSSIATEADTVSFGKLDDPGTNGDETLRRRLVNVADGRDASDAATLSQVDQALRFTRYNATDSDPNDGQDFSGPAAALGEWSLALGGEAEATGIASAAVGAEAKAGGENATAIGAQAQANGFNALAVGRQTEASGSSVVAIGSSSKATATRSVAIGTQAQSNKDSAVAIGGLSAASGLGSVALGGGGQVFASESDGRAFRTVASGRAAVAIGLHAQSAGNNSVALGAYSRTIGDFEFSVGADGSVDSNGEGVIDASDIIQRRITNVADPTASSDAATMAYVDSKVAGVSGGNPYVKIDDESGDVIEIDGEMVYSGPHPGLGYNSMAVGREARAQGFTSVAVGKGASASGDSSTAIGSLARASGSTSTAIGWTARASGNSSMAIGSANSYGDDSIAIGDASTRGNRSIAMGNSARTAENTTNSIALGYGTRIEQGASGSIVLGEFAKVGVDAQESLALGSHAIVGSGIGGAVALGASSVADMENTVSVGSSTLKRRITNVADGTGASDAATKGQLDIEIASTRSYVDTKVAGVSGGNNPFLIVDDGTGLNSDRDPATPIDNGIAERGYRSIAIGHSTTAAGAETLAVGTSASASANYALALGFEAQASALNAVALGANSVADVENTVSVGSSTLKRRIVNVADPTASSDAATMAYVDTKVAGVSGGSNPFIFIEDGTKPVTTTLPRRDDPILPNAPGTRSIAIGNEAEAYGDFSIAIGAGTNTAWDDTIVIGRGANAHDDQGIAIGLAASAQGRSVAFGPNAYAGTTASIAIGDQVSANGGSVAIGHQARAEGSSAAIGYQARAEGNGTLAFGYQAEATAIGSLALGRDSIADEGFTVSFGRPRSVTVTGRDTLVTPEVKRRLVHIADGIDASDAATKGQLDTEIASTRSYVDTKVAGVAGGSNALVKVDDGTVNPIDGESIDNIQNLINRETCLRTSADPDSCSALGNAEAGNGDPDLGYRSIAIGLDAAAPDNNAIVIGASANAGASFSLAMGVEAEANFDYALAIGYQAIATRANQFMFGTASNTYTMPGLPTVASNNAQSGDLYFVTVDANGNLGFQETPLAGQAPVSPPSGDPTPPADPDPPLNNDRQHSPRNSVPESPGALAQANTEDPQITQTSVDGGPGGAPGEGVATADGSRELASGAQEGELAMSEESQNVAEPPAQSNPNAGTRRQASTSSRSNQAALRSSQVPEVSTVSQAEFDTLAGRVTTIEGRLSGLEGRVSGLEGQVNSLFDLADTIDRDAKRGIAAIAAQANPHFPSEPGKTSYASNVATYRGEVGVSAGLMHRFGGDFAITAGVTYAGGNSTAVRAGIAGEF